MAYKWLISSLVITCFCFFEQYMGCVGCISTLRQTWHSDLWYISMRGQKTHVSAWKFQSMFIMFPYLSYFQIAVLGLKHQYIFINIYIYMYIIYHVFFRLRHVLVFKTPLGDASQASAPAPARSGRRRSPRTFFPRVPSKNACCVVFLTGA